MKRQSLYPGALDSNLNWGSQEGLEVDRQPEDRFTSDSWDLMEDAILELERQGMGYAHSIWDTDQDTGIDTEAAADQDIIRFYTDPGTERANIDGDDLNIAEYLRHLNDAATDTYIRFREDRISVEVGGIDILDITEFPAAQDTIVWNGNEANIDFRIAATGATDAFFVQGSDGFVGIGTNTPAYLCNIQSAVGADTVMCLMDETTVVVGWFFEIGDTGIAGLNAKNLVIRSNSGSSDLAFSPSTSYPGLLILDGSNGKVFINETINTFATGPSLTINQGAFDTEIIALKSSDVGHAMTNVTEADTYGFMKKVNDTLGGLDVQGYGETTFGMRLWGCVTTEDATRGTAGVGPIIVRAGKDDGANGVEALAADKNMVVIRNANNTRFIFDSDGEMHSDDIIGIGDDWDEWDDLALASDLSRLPKAKFNEMMKYKAKDFERAGLLTLSVDEEGTQHAFLRNKALHQFAMCCFSDIHDRFITVDERLNTYERAFEKISQKLGIPKMELLALGN